MCSGAACFSAINKREKHFSDYSGEDIEVCAFFHCNGCGCDYDTDKEFIEKINRIPKLGIEAVHIGKCTVLKGSECEVITKIIGIIENYGIKIVRGTH